MSSCGVQASIDPSPSCAPGQGQGSAGASYTATINANVGDAGSKLPPLDTDTTWTVGADVEVSWALKAWHGGATPLGHRPPMSPCHHLSAIPASWYSHQPPLWVPHLAGNPLHSSHRSYQPQWRLGPCRWHALVGPPSVIPSYRRWLLVSPLRGGQRTERGLLPEDSPGLHWYLCRACHVHAMYAMCMPCMPGIAHHLPHAPPPGPLQATLPSAGAGSGARPCPSIAPLGDGR